MMCASPGTIREIMLAADDLNMIDSGEYVFFNIELYTGWVESKGLEQKSLFYLNLNWTE